MTRLAGIGGPTPLPAGTRAPPSGPGPAFEMPEGAPTPSAAAPQSGGVVALSGLLALQETDTPSDVREREARRRGRSVLEALSSLQRTLLGGGDPDAAAAQLASTVATMTASGDPALQAILAAVKLRAMVELARHEKSDNETAG